MCVRNLTALAIILRHHGILVASCFITVQPKGRWVCLKYSSARKCLLFVAETMGWGTPASNLRWSQEKTRRVNTLWLVGNIQFEGGVSKTKPQPFIFTKNDKTLCRGQNYWPHRCFLVTCSAHLLSLSLGKNKRVGKQLASQKILQMLHPHVKNWGSLLRMYGRESNKMVKKVSQLWCWPQRSDRLTSLSALRNKKKMSLSGKQTWNRHETKWLVVIGILFSYTLGFFVFFSRITVLIL